APRDGGIYVDATFGAGGYSRAILEAAKCDVWGIDRDPEAGLSGAELERDFPGRLTILCGRFGDMTRLLEGLGANKADGVAFDLGVSSMQIDESGRGFSFQSDGPLDMRMGKAGVTAADVVNGLAEKDLADLIYINGEERASRRIARAIVKARAKTPFTGTGQLADLVRGVVKRAKDGVDPATRTFQALRIYVNDELGELDRGLCAAESLLAPGGRLAVVSFHSLEDRRVKDFLRRRSGAHPRESRHLPSREEPSRDPSFRLLRRGVLKPSAAETAANPRARSARLRAAERTSAPAWSQPPSNGRAAA
ncbi:MAG TPA: 16S rRNA (cytosine(1402)-N(4))-methyltransferase RsmH, partial [Rhodospirillales bacterium]|nr:16S rRNA (cytosine(1402)-N(4))-methyltransferase RsmH [Rhodospirillales bacterium]